MIQTFTKWTNGKVRVTSRLEDGEVRGQFCERLTRNGKWELVQHGYDGKRDKIMTAFAAATA